MTISFLLASRLRDALAGIAASEPHVAPAADARFGDYQTNVAMALARELSANPRQLAQKIVEALEVSDICEKPEVAGAGFINFKLTRDFWRSASRR